MIWPEMPWRVSGRCVYATYMPYSWIAPVSAAGVAFLSLAVAGPASAHFGFVDLQARDGDIKAAPCGDADSSRSNNVYTFRPGATINITVNESIPHPGYFRIAFDGDGVDDFVVPSGTEGIDGNCNGDPNCGEPEDADYCNSPAVMWDNLDQHPGGEGGNRTWTITLPNIECDNCTLQVIQMMNDLNIHASPLLGHGPFPLGDIYYGCIDLVLSNDADEVDDAPVTNDGMQCDSFDAAATMGGGSGTGGTNGGTTGSATTGTTGAATTTSTGGGATNSTGTTAGVGDGGVVATTAGTTGGTTTTTVGGTTGVTSGLNGSTLGTTAAPESSDSGGCTVGPRASQRTGLAMALWMLGLCGLLWVRRRA